MNQGSSTPPGPVLPYDAEVEYLQSDGNQLIKFTDTIYSATDAVDMEFTLIAQVNTTSAVFGTRVNASVRNFSCLVASNNNIVLDLNDGSYATYRVNSGTTGYNKRCVIHMERSSKYIKFDGTTVASSTATSQSFSEPNVDLFGIGLMNRPSIKLYFFQWRRNGSLLHDLIPVRVGQVGYMYDKVSGTLFGNNDTGNFVLGPDVNS